MSSYWLVILGLGIVITLLVGIICGVIKTSAHKKLEKTNNELYKELKNYKRGYEILRKDFLKIYEENTRLKKKKNNKQILSEEAK